MRNDVRDAAKTVGNLIDKANVAIVGSVDGDGFPNSKAMLPPREREGIRVIYFSTNASSMRVAQYMSNPKACVYFFDRRFYKGVMLRGSMEVMQDSGTRELIWRPGDEMYYPQGVTAPDYCVLRFTATDGRYYSNFKSEDFVVA